LGLSLIKLGVHGLVFAHIGLKVNNEVGEVTCVWFGGGFSVIKFARDSMAGWLLTFGGLSECILLKILNVKLKLV
jgi:hypothetical protein